MNTHEEYVTYAQAKALKELGFDWPCECHYAKEDALYDCFWMANSGQYPTNSLLKDIGGERTTAPTQAVACRWLREEKGIHLSPFEYDLTKHTWVLEGESIGGGDRDVDYENEYPTYESALSAGIDSALELLKGGEK